MVRINLDPTAPASEARSLAEILLSGNDGEDEIALRNGGQLGLRLIASAPLPLSVGPTLRSDREYLITGGFGSLGLSAAHWLVDHGAKNLVLLGQSALPPRTKWGDAQDPISQHRISAIRALENKGAQVRTECADVADLSAMTQALEGRSIPLGGIIHAAGTRTWQEPHGRGVH